MRKSRKGMSPKHIVIGILSELAVFAAVLGVLFLIVLLATLIAGSRVG